MDCANRLGGAERAASQHIERQNLYDQDVALEKGVRLPKAFDEYIHLLEKKRVFKKVVNENIGHTRHYGYLGTGKRTASKRLFEALTEVAVSYAEGYGYRFTEDARAELSQYFGYEYKMRGTDFQNIHLAHRIVDDKILPSLINRMVDGTTLNGIDDAAVTITVDDIPKIRHRDPQKAIERLQSLVGLENIKKSIMAHVSLVNLNRKRMALGLFNHMPPMHMVFTSNPGTGKTTVAEILCRIMQGAGLLPTNHFSILNIEEFAGMRNPMSIVEKAMLKSGDGMLFLDLDSPNYRDYNTDFLQYWIENKRKELNLNLAVVIARTMQLLASTVAQIAQLRIFHDATADRHLVTKADTDRLEWNEASLNYRRIGF